ncbi:MAG: hypothetical protein IKY59_04640, partial [Oscillospiraceae bacterium]|nr:hypothetical protein [Oscillospiraceae bacterium]
MSKKIIGATVGTTRNPNWVDKKIQPLSKEIEDHKQDKENPHDVTAEQVGAAPAGYGLGKFGTDVSDIICDTSDKLNAKTTNGFWVYKSDTVNLVKDFDSKYVKGITLGYNKYCATQIGVCNGNGKVIIREMYGNVPGNWGNWKYLLDAIGAAAAGDIVGLATEAFVKNAIAAAQFETGGNDIDLSGFVSRSDLEAVSKLIGDKKVSEQIIAAINSIIYPVTKVNGQTGDISLKASDVGAVPTTRTVNNKALSTNITLSAADVGAVPTTRKVN